MENYQPSIKRPRYVTRSVAREKQQQLNLEYINTDCIFKIFDHLNVIELSMIADTNKRLRALAQDQFKRKFGDVDLCVISNGRKWNASRIFRNFGQLISDLSISGECRHKSVFGLIGKYCRLETLTHLHLQRMIIDEFIMKTLHPFFCNIEFLKVTNCNAEKLVEFPETFKRLKSLELTLTASFDHSLIEKVIRSKFPQLEELKISICGYRPTRQDYICCFIRRHPKLKVLSFEKCSLTSETIEVIAKTMTQLEHFELKGNNQTNQHDPRIHQAMLPFGSIKTLKKLILDCTNYWSAFENLFEAFVANNIGIEHVHLINLNLTPKVLLQLKGLKTIRTLIFKLTHRIYVKRFIEVAEYLPLLNEFHLICVDPVSGELLNSLLRKSSELTVLQIETPTFTMNDREYSNMLKIIKKRPCEIGLEIKICSASVQIDVPNDTIKANKKWIRIVINTNVYDRRFDWFRCIIM